MNQNHLPSPEEERLHALLRETRPAPPLPPRFQDAVWRRIESAENAQTTASPWSWLDRLVERLLVPRFAVAGLAALLVAGGITGVITGNDTARRQAEQRYLAAVAPNAFH